MKTSGKGTAGENRVGAYLEEKGFVIGGRRHRRGGGDWLAVRLDGFEFDKATWTVLLIEVKASSVYRGPYADFLPKERTDLLETAREIEAEPWLAWTPTKNRIELIPADEWPVRKVR